jgi:formylmethanofuran dehydrogenase subunit E
MISLMMTWGCTAGARNLNSRDLGNLIAENIEVMMNDGRTRVVRIAGVR